MILNTVIIKRLNEQNMCTSKGLSFTCIYHVKEKKYLSIREIPLVKDLESKIEKAETTSLLSYLKYTVNSML